MHLYFIRHGQSTNNANWANKEEEGYERSADPPLTDLGFRQAQALANYIVSSRFSSDEPKNIGEYRHNLNFTHLYSSLMLRAIQTGTILSETLGIPLYGLPEVHEIGGIYLETLIGGNLTTTQEYGVTPLYLQENFPDFKLHQPINERGWWQGGVEPAGAPLSRATAAINLLKERHLGTNDHVAVVTHGGFFNSMARMLFSVQPNEPENRKLRTWFSFCNCAVSRIDFVNGRIEWIYHNFTNFLDDELVTC